MRLYLMLSVLLGSTVFCFPATMFPEEQGAVSAEPSGSMGISISNTDVMSVSAAQDGRAATLYKLPSRNPGQNRNPDDWVALPGDNPGRGFCIDMSNLFGNWDQATRSLSVSKGFRCGFYSEMGCSKDATGAMWVEIGEKGREVGVDRLEKMDRKIRSAECWML